MKRIRKGALAAGITTILVMGISVGPAAASVNSASGSLTCTGNQTLRVSIVTDSPAKVTFYLSGIKRYTDPGGGTDHIYNYGASGGSWKVTTPGNIKTTTDYCSAAVLAPAA